MSPQTVTGDETGWTLLSSANRSLTLKARESRRQHGWEKWMDGAPTRGGRQSFVRPRPGRGRMPKEEELCHGSCEGRGVGMRKEEGWKSACMFGGRAQGCGRGEGGQLSRRLTIWQRSFRSFSGRYSHCRTFAIQPSRSAPCTLKEMGRTEILSGGWKLSPLQCPHISPEQHGRKKHRNGTENRILVMILLPRMPHREAITGAGSGASSKASSGS